MNYRLRLTALIVTIVLVAWGLYLRFVNGLPWANWTGFEQKTLWDWMELLIIPAAISLVALWFNITQHDYELRIAEQRVRNDQEIALDNLRETTLKDYLEKMAQLLLEKDLRISKPESEVRDVARAQTLTVLRTLDNKRKALLVRFLYEANLISSSILIIDLSDADLEGMDFDRGDLPNINFSGANLRGASFRSANLAGANFSNANLDDSSFMSAKLDGANFAHAKLNFAELADTTLRSTDLSHASIVNSRVVGADFSNANLEHTDLISCNLTDARFKGANLQSTSLYDSNLEGITLTRAQANGAWLGDREVKIMDDETITTKCSECNNEFKIVEQWTPDRTGNHSGYVVRCNKCSHIFHLDLDRVFNSYHVKWGVQILATYDKEVGNKQEVLAKFGLG